MAWLNDLSAALGLPIGAVTLATSLVLAAEKAEKEARPEALRDIAEALKNPRWTEAFRPNLQIRRVFESTFSGRHLSWKCLRRSMAASVIFILALIGFFITRTGRNPFEQLTTFYPGVWYKVFLIVLFFLLTFSCAFIALYKTRVIVRKMSRAGNMMAVIFYMLLDIGLSLTIPFALGATLFITIEFIAGYLDAESWAALESDIATYPVVVSQSLLCVLTLGGCNHDHFWPGLFLASTLFTSVWAIATTLSVFILKFIITSLEPVRVFMNWFFPIENHPIRSIGILSAVVILIGAFVLSLL